MTDFGLAKVLSAQPDGRPADLSELATLEAGSDDSGPGGGDGPLHGAGANSGEPLTPAADLFALGVVLYEMIGRHPFEGAAPLETRALAYSETW